MIEWTTIIRWKTTGTNHEAKYFEKIFSTFLHKVREQDVGSPYCYGPSANYMYYWYNKAKERIISP